MTDVAHVVVALLSGALISAVLWDAFETVILPRSVVRRFRLARALIRATWFPWRVIAARMSPARSERFLAFFGPLALLALIAIWAMFLVFGFAGLQWAAGSRLASLNADSWFVLAMCILLVVSHGC
jgi:hypothetical protein